MTGMLVRERNYHNCFIEEDKALVVQSVQCSAGVGRKMYVNE